MLGSIKNAGRALDAATDAGASTSRGARGLDEAIDGATSTARGAEGATQHAASTGRATDTGSNLPSQTAAPEGEAFTIERRPPVQEEQETAAVFATDADSAPELSSSASNPLPDTLPARQDGSRPVTQEGTGRAELDQPSPMAEDGLYDDPARWGARSEQGTEIPDAPEDALPSTVPAREDGSKPVTRLGVSHGERHLPSDFPGETLDQQGLSRSKAHFEASAVQFFDSKPTRQVTEAELTRKPEPFGPIYSQGKGETVSFDAADFADPHYTPKVGDPDFDIEGASLRVPDAKAAVFPETMPRNPDGSQPITQTPRNPMPHEKNIEDIVNPTDAHRLGLDMEDYVKSPLVGYEDVDLGLEQKFDALAARVDDQIQAVREKNTALNAAQDASDTGSSAELTPPSVPETKNTLRTQLLAQGHKADDALYALGARLSPEGALDGVHLTESTGQMSAVGAKQLTKDVQAVTQALGDINGRPALTTAQRDDAIGNLGAAMDLLPSNTPEGRKIDTLLSQTKVQNTLGGTNVADNIAIESQTGRPLSPNAPSNRSWHGQSDMALAKQEDQIDAFISVVDNKRSMQMRGEQWAALSPAEHRAFHDSVFADLTAQTGVPAQMQDLSRLKDAARAQAPDTPSVYEAVHDAFAGPFVTMRHVESGPSYVAPKLDTNGRTHFEVVTSKADLENGSDMASAKLALTQVTQLNQQMGSTAYTALRNSDAIQNLPAQERSVAINIALTEMGFDPDQARLAAMTQVSSNPKTTIKSDWRAMEMGDTVGKAQVRLAEAPPSATVYDNPFGSPSSAPHTAHPADLDWGDLKTPSQDKAAMQSERNFQNATLAAAVAGTVATGALLATSQGKSE